MNLRYWGMKKKLPVSQELPLLQELHDMNFSIFMNGYSFFGRFFNFLGIEVIGSAVILTYYRATFFFQLPLKVTCQTLSCASLNLDIGHETSGLFGKIFYCAILFQCCNRSSIVSLFLFVSKGRILRWWNRVRYWSTSWLRGHSEALVLILSVNRYRFYRKKFDGKKGQILMNISIQKSDKNPIDVESSNLNFQQGF